MNVVRKDDVCLTFRNPYHKSLYVTTELSQLLRKYDCTFDEAEGCLHMLLAEIKAQRECKEYATLNDYFKGRKTHICDNDIVTPLNRVPEICGMSD